MLTDDEDEDEALRNGNGQRGSELVRALLKDVHEDDDNEENHDDDDVDPRTGLPCRYDSTPRGCAAPKLVDEIFARANEEMVPVTIGGTEVFRLRRGAVAVLMGAPGGGKTTFAVSASVEHARDRGPAIYLTRELARDELGARIAGMLCDASWEDALCGRVARDRMEAALALPRLRILDGDDTTLTHLWIEIDHVRKDYPDEPILVAIDYLQIMDSDEREARSRVERIVEDIRRSVQRERVVALAVSQTSRNAGKAMRSGESLGIDTMTAGAESSAIERAAYVTIAIGLHGVEDHTGTRPVDLSLGKHRMGSGDRVIPATYNGRTGRWTITGAAEPTARVKAARAIEHEQMSTAAARLAIEMAAGQSNKPVTREELCGKTGQRAEVARKALADLLAEGALIEVQRKRPRSRVWMIWTPERAAAAGVPVVGEGADA